MIATQASGVAPPLLTRGIEGAITRRFAAKGYLVLANDLAAEAAALWLLPRSDRKRPEL